MEIKPIRPIQPVTKAEIPQSKIDAKQSRSPIPIQAPQGQWGYTKGQIIINGQNVARLIEQSAHKPTSFWSQLANDLAAFLNFTVKQNVKRRKRKRGGQVIVEEYDPTGELEHLSALVEAYIGKIMRIIKRKYDETADGLSYSLDEDGQLSLNGMNVTSFIEVARTYPSKKARIFLKGLKNRLSLILANKNQSPSYEKIRDITQNLFEEIDQEINRIVEKERLLENK